MLKNLNSRPNTPTNLIPKAPKKQKIIYYDDAVRLFGEYESELRLCKEELEKMKKKDSKEDKSNKLVYLEGASWMLDKLLPEVSYL